MKSISFDTNSIYVSFNTFASLSGIHRKEQPHSIKQRFTFKICRLRIPAKRAGKSLKKSLRLCCKYGIIKEIK